MRRNVIRLLGMLLVVLMLVSVLPAALLASGTDIQTEASSAQENFDQLTEVSALGWTFPEGQPELASVGSGKALKFQSQLAPNRGKIEIPFDGTEKTLKFDFMTETALSSVFGFYVQLYRETGCKNGLAPL